MRPHPVMLARTHLFLLLAGWCMTTSLCADEPGLEISPIHPREVLQGQPIQLGIEVRNTSDRPIVFVTPLGGSLSGTQYPHIAVEILDSEGKPIPPPQPTEAAQPSEVPPTVPRRVERCGTPSPRLMMPSNVRKLAPGEKSSVVLGIPGFASPGTWQIRISYDLRAPNREAWADHMEVPPRHFTAEQANEANENLALVAPVLLQSATWSIEVRELTPALLADMICRHHAAETWCVLCEGGMNLLADMICRHHAARTRELRDLLSAGEWRLADLRSMGTTNGGAGTAFFSGCVEWMGPSKAPEGFAVGRYLLIQEGFDVGPGEAVPVPVFERESDLPRYVVRAPEVAAAMVKQRMLSDRLGFPREPGTPKPAATGTDAPKPPDRGPCFTFHDVPLEEALQAIASGIQRKIDIDPQAREIVAGIRVNAEDLPLARILEEAVEKSGKLGFRTEGQNRGNGGATNYARIAAEWLVKDKGLVRMVITKRVGVLKEPAATETDAPKAPGCFTFHDVSLEEALQAIASEIQRKIEIDPQAREIVAGIRVNAEDLPLARILEEAVEKSGKLGFRVESRHGSGETNYARYAAEWLVKEKEFVRMVITKRR